MSKQEAKRRAEDFGTEFEEKVLYINRCSKVIKGGRNKVTSALVGTFLGILLCYGMVGPLASNMSKLVSEEHSYYAVLRFVPLLVHLSDFAWFMVGGGTQ